MHLILNALVWYIIGRLNNDIIVLASTLQSCMIPNNLVNNKFIALSSIKKRRRYRRQIDRKWFLLRWTFRGLGDIYENTIIVRDVRDSRTWFPNRNEGAIYDSVISSMNAPSQPNRARLRIESVSSAIARTMLLPQRDRNMTLFCSDRE